MSEGRHFNWALLLGCFAIAFGIFLAGVTIASHIPHQLSVPWHSQSFHNQPPQHVEPQEFMTEWEAAIFLSISHFDFRTLVELGELSGTYAAFEVERRVLWPVVIGSNSDMVMYDHRIFGFAGEVIHSRLGSEIVPPRIASPHEIEHEIVMEYHRVFSREKLTEWLNNRIVSNN
ncbi:MAG: hypothetical protein FWC89_11335 [Defluviitaleaceae bacterium]|nr:hypothetical protein [Defluviitaleaceae bacterium]